MNKEKGFTLIEVLMIIIILAIIFTLLAPNLGMFTGRISDRELERQKDLVIIAANMYTQDRSHRFYHGESRCITVVNLQENGYIGEATHSSIEYVFIPPTRNDSPCIIGVEACGPCP